MIIDRALYVMVLLAYASTWLVDSKLAALLFGPVMLILLITSYADRKLKEK